ncbi:MAG TPA: hypothetical protein VKV23_09850 [Acidimicrobiales bacterium]|nr:hypothetical protein [Acidimicrobiales bacterium]
MTTELAGRPDAAPRRLPPVAEACVASMALVVVGGIYLASYLPSRAPLGPAVGLVAAAGALLAANAAALARLRAFAWERFLLVLRWALLGYAVISGMLEYVFVLDHTRGTMLVLLTVMLVVFAINIPLLLAFSVARYHEVEPAREA